jgi:hypothetical protein
MDVVAKNEQWLNDRADEVRASIDEIRGILGDVAYLQLGWRPPDGGWSIAQVFEHLLISDRAYLPEMGRLIERGSKGSTPWKPTFFGGLLARSLAPTATRKLPSPRNWRPAPEARAHVIDEYIEAREELLALIERAHGVDLSRNRMSSPVAKLIRLNLGDTINILVVHTQRHLQQIARIRNHPEFPTS